MNQEDNSYLVSQAQYRLAQMKVSKLTSAIALGLTRPGYAPAYRRSEP